MRALGLLALFGLWGGIGCHGDSRGSADLHTPTCAELNCGAHVTCATTASGVVCQEACEPGFAWQAASKSCATAPASCKVDDPQSIATMCADLHRACTETVTGATCGGCVAQGPTCWVGPGTAAEGDCRAPTTCDTCGANRVCVPATTCSDAACGGCMPMFIDDGSGTCRPVNTDVACAAQNRTFVAVGASGYCGDCVPDAIAIAGQCALPSCGTAAGSLGAVCQQEKRTCVPGTPPMCGDCLPGTQLSADGTTCTAVTGATCQKRADCAESIGLYCVQMTTSDEPKCATAPCAVGQIWDRTKQTCKDFACSTGSPWPVSDRNGKGYCGADESFYDSPNLQLLRCDKDGDGWLNKLALDELTKAAGSPLDYTVLANLRCPLTVVTKIVLQNEWGQQKELSFSGDLKLAVTQLPLYENPDNDTGDHGLGNLPADAVNSLTKICDSADAARDLNKNGVSDVDEDQAAMLKAEVAWAQPYQLLTHYLEEHSVSLTKTADLTSAAACTDTSCSAIPVDAQAVTLTIKERSRCLDTPFTYADTGGWWKSCTVRRDGKFKSATPLGYDFASFDCSATDGACNLWSDGGPWVPQPSEGISPPVVQPLPPLRSFAHGLCDGSMMSMRVPPTAPWRGMTHYNQFRCAKVIASPDLSKRSQVKTDDVQKTLGDAGTWVRQSCAAQAGSPKGEARFSCSAALGAPTEGTVYWLARRYKDYPSASNYDGGCLNEGAEWSLLCPGDRSLAIGDRSNFGRVICGPPCPKDDAFYNASYWVCGYPVASAFTDGVTTQFESPVEAAVHYSVLWGSAGTWQ